MKTNRLITPPNAEPVTLADMKAHAKIEDTADDALIDALIRAARQWCEHYTRRAFVNQSWAMTLSTPPKVSYVTLPRAPLQTVTSAKLYNDKDEASDWDVGNFFIDAACEPAQLVLRTGAMWPMFDRVSSALRIEYVAGYGADGSAVPETIKLAIKQLALHWYECRGDAIVGQSITQAPMTIEALLQSYRLVQVGEA